MDKMKDYKEKIFSIIDLNNKINSYDEDSQNINMVNEDLSKKQNINMGNEDLSENALFCKVILVGEYNVGKTKIITSFKT
jgi:GTPase SAR1 family protein